MERSDFSLALNVTTKLYYLLDLPNLYLPVQTLEPPHNFLSTILGYLELNSEFRVVLSHIAAWHWHNKVLFWYLNLIRANKDVLCHQYDVENLIMNPADCL